MAPRILIVEDNADLARALVRFLTRAGYEVVHAESCAAADEIKSSFAVGILDLELRDGYGFNLSERLLRRSVVGSVIFFTGTVDPDLLARAESLAPCIPKCEGMDSLMRALHAALASQPRQAAGSENDTPVPSTPKNSRG